MVLREVGVVVDDVRPWPGHGWMPVEMTLSDESIADSTGQVIDLDSLSLDRHEEHSFLLLSHSRQLVGQFKEPGTNRYTVHRSGSRLVGTGFLFPNRLGRQVWRLHRAGLLPCCSVGTLVHRAETRTRADGVKVVHGAELWEASLVPLGANPNALLRQFEAALDGERVCPTIVRAVNAMDARRKRIEKRLGHDLEDRDWLTIEDRLDRPHARRAVCELLDRPVTDAEWKAIRRKLSREPGYNRVLTDLADLKRCLKVRRW